MKTPPPQVEIPAVWTAVLLAWFKAVPWAELAAAAAFIYTLLRIYSWFRKKE